MKGESDPPESKSLLKFVSETAKEYTDTLRVLSGTDISDIDFKQIRSVEEEIIQSIFHKICESNKEDNQNFANYSIARKMRFYHFLSRLKEKKSSTTEIDFRTFSEFLEDLEKIVNTMIPTHEQTVLAIQEIASILRTCPKSYIQKKEMLKIEKENEKKVAILNQENQLLKSELEMLRDSLRRRENENYTFVEKMIQEASSRDAKTIQCSPGKVYKIEVPSPLRYAEGMYQWSDKKSSNPISQTYSPLVKTGHLQIEETDGISLNCETWMNEIAFLKAELEIKTQETTRLKEEIEYMQERASNNSLYMKDSGQLSNISDMQSFSKRNDDRFIQKVNEIREMYSSELEKVKNEKNSDRKRFQDELDVVERNLRQLLDDERKKYNNYIEEIEEKNRRELTKMQGKIDSMQCKRSESERLLKREIDSLEQKIIKMRDENMHLESLLGKANVDNQLINSDRNSILEKLKFVQTQNEELEFRLKEEVCQIEMRRLESKFEGKANGNKHKEIQEAEILIEELKLEIEKKNRVILELRSTISSLQSKVEQGSKGTSLSLENTISGYKQIIESLEANLEAEKAKVHQLEDDGKKKEERLYNEIGTLHNVLASRKSTGTENKKKSYLFNQYNSHKSVIEGENSHVAYDSMKGSGYIHKSGVIEMRSKDISPIEGSMRNIKDADILFSITKNRGIGENSKFITDVRSSMLKKSSITDSANAMMAKAYVQKHKKIGSIDSKAMRRKHVSITSKNFYNSASTETESYSIAETDYCSRKMSLYAEKPYATQEGRVERDLNIKIKELKKLFTGGEKCKVDFFNKKSKASIEQGQKKVKHIFPHYDLKLSKIKSLKNIKLRSDENRRKTEC